MDSSVTNFPARAKPITPHNTNQLTDHDDQEHDQTVFCGTGGVVSCVPSGNPDDTPVDFLVPDGGFVPVKVRIVLATGTTADDLVGLF